MSRRRISSAILAAVSAAPFCGGVNSLWLSRSFETENAFELATHFATRGATWFGATIILLVSALALCLSERRATSGEPNEATPPGSSEQSDVRVGGL